MNSFSGVNSCRLRFPVQPLASLWLLEHSRLQVRLAHPGHRYLAAAVVHTSQQRPAGMAAAPAGGTRAHNSSVSS